MIDRIIELKEQLLREGGAHLKVARSFLQWHVQGGDRVTWGSQQTLPITVAQIEELAADVAATTMASMEEKAKAKKPERPDDWDGINYGDLTSEENELIRKARRAGFAAFYPMGERTGELTLKAAQKFLQQQES